MTTTLTASALDLTGERPRKLLNYVAGEWVEGSGRFATLQHAVTVVPVAEASVVSRLEEALSSVAGGARPFSRRVPTGTFPRSETDHVPVHCPDRILLQ